MTVQHRVDTHDMLLIHRVIRREIGRLPGLFRHAGGSPARARVVAAHAREMLEFLHTHHSGEDQLLWPVLRPRVRLDDALIDRMEAQHAELAVAIEDVQQQLPGWERTADRAVGERMAERLESAHQVLLAHLAEEEERILPLVAEHFTQHEWDALGRHGMGAVPGRRRMVILGHILDETDPAERASFLRQVPPPARVAYRLIGRRQYAREAATIRT
ncbi:MAG: hemerythrin domain-containing protein [Mycobacteriaceae bacterium]